MALVETLRAATRDMHASIERRVPLMRPDADVGTYRAYLLAMLGFHVPLEARLERLPRAFAEDVMLSRRAKAPRLRADLEAIGGGAGDVPICADVPEVHTADHGFGVLYVLEGSTLGAAVIARHLAPRVPLEGRSRYLRAYGADAGSMWRALVAALEAHGRAPGTDADAVVYGATETFRTLEAWLVRQVS